MKVKLISLALLSLVSQTRSQSAVKSWTFDDAYSVYNPTAMVYSNTSHRAYTFGRMTESYYGDDLIYIAKVKAGRAAIDDLHVMEDITNVSRVIKHPSDDTDMIVTGTGLTSGLSSKEVPFVGILSLYGSSYRWSQFKFFGDDDWDIRTVEVIEDQDMIVCTGYLQYIGYPHYRYENYFVAFDLSDLSQLWFRTHSARYYNNYYTTSYPISITNLGSGLMAHTNTGYTYYDASGLCLFELDRENMTSLWCKGMTSENDDTDDQALAGLHYDSANENIIITGTKYVSCRTTYGSTTSCYYPFIRAISLNGEVVWSRIIVRSDASNNRDWMVQSTMNNDSRSVFLGGTFTDDSSYSSPFVVEFSLDSISIVSWDGWDGATNYPRYYYRPTSGNTLAVTDDGRPIMACKGYYSSYADMVTITGTSCLDWFDSYMEWDTGVTLTNATQELMTDYDDSSLDTYNFDSSYSFYTSDFTRTKTLCGKSNSGSSSGGSSALAIGLAVGLGVPFCLCICVCYLCHYMCTESSRRQRAIQTKSRNNVSTYSAPVTVSKPVTTTHTKVPTMTITATTTSSVPSSVQRQPSMPSAEAKRSSSLVNTQSSMKPQPMMVPGGHVGYNPMMSGAEPGQGGSAMGMGAPGMGAPPGYPGPSGYAGPPPGYGASQQQPYGGGGYPQYYGGMAGPQYGAHMAGGPGMGAPWMGPGGMAPHGAGGYGFAPGPDASATEGGAPPPAYGMGTAEFEGRSGARGGTAEIRGGGHEGMVTREGP